MSRSLFHFSNFYAESPSLLRIGKCIYSLLDSQAQRATKAGQAQLSTCSLSKNLSLRSKFCFFHPAVYMVCSLTLPGRNDLLNCCLVWSHWDPDNQLSSEMYHCNHGRLYYITQCQLHKDLRKYLPVSNLRDTFVPPEPQTGLYPIYFFFWIASRISDTNLMAFLDVCG